MAVVRALLRLPTESTVSAPARPIRPGSAVNEPIVDQTASAIVIIAIGMATPVTVSAAGSRLVSASRTPSTRAAGSRTSRDSRAIGDRGPPGGLGCTAATGGTRPARQAGIAVAMSTVKIAPAAMSRATVPGRGDSVTPMPAAGWTNAGDVAIRAV